MMASAHQTGTQTPVVIINNTIASDDRHDAEGQWNIRRPPSVECAKDEIQVPLAKSVSKDNILEQGEQKTEDT